jgi:hypothetical protein
MSQYCRRQFLIAAGAMLAAPLPCVAQQDGKVWRVGVLSLLSRPESLDAVLCMALFPESNA